MTITTDMKKINQMLLQYCNLLHIENKLLWYLQSNPNKTSLTRQVL